MTNNQISFITEPLGLYPMLVSFLLANRICASKSDVSRKILRRSGNYLSMLEWTRKEPPLSVSLTIAAELEKLTHTTTLKDATKAVLLDFTKRVRADIADRVERGAA